MRLTVAVGAAVSTLLVGIIGISVSAQQAKPATDTQAANESYAAAKGVFGGIGVAAGEAVVFFGVAAIVLVSLGLLVVAGRGGR
jgi:hypothetical protein